MRISGLRACFKTWLACTSRPPALSSFRAVYDLEALALLWPSSRSIRSIIALHQGASRRPHRHWCCCGPHRAASSIAPQRGASPHRVASRRPHRGASSIIAPHRGASRRPHQGASRRPLRGERRDVVYCLFCVLCHLLTEDLLSDRLRRGLRVTL
jgi:hypothetical protein